MPHLYTNPSSDIYLISNVTKHFKNKNVIKVNAGAGEMAQWLRVLAALPEDLGFNSQHPHGSSQLSIISVPGYLTHSHRHTHRQNTSEYKIKNE